MPNHDNPVVFYKPQPSGEARGFLKDYAGSYIPGSQYDIQEAFEKGIGIGFYLGLFLSASTVLRPDDVEHPTVDDVRGEGSLISIEGLKNTEMQLWEKTKEGINQMISEKISTIKEVEYIYIFQDENTLHVWSIINNPDRAARDKIYEKELEILDQIPDIFFDFHVLFRNNQSIEEVGPSEANLIFERTST